jgi:type I restriction enzyme S subunit
VLNQADAVRVKRREALALLDDLTQSIFLDMFGNPMANERGWPVVSVADFVDGFESGKNLVADDLSNRASPYRVLRTSAITSLRFRPDQTKPVPQDYEPPLRHFVKDGDLLFGRANTGELIGATALVNGVGSNVLLPDKIWRFKWPLAAASDPTWVMHLFRTPAFRHELTRRASGTSSSMKNISQQKVLSIRTCLPDLAQQRAFAEKVNASESTRTACERSGDDLARLFSSLQQRAFAGEL